MSLSGFSSMMEKVFSPNLLTIFSAVDGPTPFKTPDVK